jgi:cell division septation protein DedD
VPDPQTHYQLSFTTRQAVALFVGLLVALGLAYFLGLMTGVAGRAPKVAVEPAPSPAPSPAEAIAAAEQPTPIRPPRRTTSVPPFPKPVLGTDPTAAPSLQFFEDRAETPAGPAQRTPAPRATPPHPAPPAATASTASTGDFWVQVLSLSSEPEARVRRDKLIHRGYRARVELAQAPKGGKVYRVRVGPYSRREEAERASERLSKEEKVRTWIAPSGK